MPGTPLHLLAVARPPTGAGFDVVLLLHVACALVGTLAVAVSAVQAARLRRLPAGPPRPANLQAYYAPGANWAGRTLYGVPVFGFVLLAMSKGAFGLKDAWVLAGLATWIVAIGLGEGALWPAERRLQQLMASSAATHDARGGVTSAAAPTELPTPAPAPRQLAAECRTVLLTSAGMLVLLVLAFVLMVAQP